MTIQQTGTARAGEGVGRLPQDLHIHTVMSIGDSAVVPQQTLDLIARVRHADIIGISDHLSSLREGRFAPYRAAVLAHGFHVGIEVTHHSEAAEAVNLDVEYYVYHCGSSDEDYRQLDILRATGRPVIVAHPQALDTDLNRVPGDCLIEISNRYSFLSDWLVFFRPFVDKFRFVLSSDAHQPNWLGHGVARCVARELGVRETILFPREFKGIREIQH